MNDVCTPLLSRPHAAPGITSWQFLSARDAGALEPWLEVIVLPRGYVIASLGRSIEYAVDPVDFDTMFQRLARSP